MAETGYIVYLSTEFGHKNSDVNGHIILEGRQTEIVNIIIMDIGNHRS